MMLTKLTYRIKIIVCFLSITVCSGAGPCRVEANSSRICLPFFTKVGIPTWGAGGAYVAEKGYLTAAFGNPEGLSSEKTTFYLEAGRRFPARWLGMAQAKWDDHFILPGFVSVAKPLSGLNLSIGYMNYYDLSMRDSIEVIISAH